jgi:hypothetical protein
MLAETFGTRLPSGIGAYNIPLLVLGAWAALRRRGESDLVLLIWVVVVSVGLALTLPDHRYFMIVFPALAILMARGVASVSNLPARAIPLALLYNLGALYLFVDWERAANLLGN